MYVRMKINVCNLSIDLIDITYDFLHDYVFCKINSVCAMYVAAYIATSLCTTYLCNCISCTLVIFRYQLLLLPLDFIYFFINTYSVHSQKCLKLKYLVLTSTIPGVYTQPIIIHHLAIWTETTFSTSANITGCRRITGLRAHGTTLLKNHSLWTCGCKRINSFK